MVSRYRILAITVLVPFLYQNCSESANFSSASKSTSGLGVDRFDDPNTPPITVVRTPPGIDDDVDFSKCESYQEIGNVASMALPNRSTSKVCYYKKLLSAVASHSSGSHGEARVTDVLASNHNGNENSYIAPYLLGDGRLKFSNLPGWKIAISGAYNDTKTKMAIDNFYLLQLKSPQIEFISAFGTADAEPGDGDMPILLNNTEITEFKSFAAGGTARVEALDLTPETSMISNFKGEYSLRLRALDCGGSANGTDVFVVFH